MGFHLSICNHIVLSHLSNITIIIIIIIIIIIKINITTVTSTMSNYLDHMAFAMVFDIVARLFLVLENPYWGMIAVICQIAKNTETADGVLETLTLTFVNWTVSYYIRDLGNHALAYDFWLVILFSVWFRLFKAYLGSAVFAVADILTGQDGEQKQTVLNAIVRGEGQYEGVPCTCHVSHMRWNP